MTSEPTIINWFKKKDIFAGSELAVIEVLQRRSLIVEELVLVAAGLAVWAHRNGHPCVYLDALQEQLSEVLSKDEDSSQMELLSRSAAFISALQSSPGVVRVVDTTSLGTYLSACADVRPLVLFENRLFTQRQFADELSIAEQLVVRAKRKSSLTADIAQINRIVPGPSADDEEAKIVGDTGIANRAAQSVVSNCLTVLTGGPGTGKTHTLTRCLAVLLSAHEHHLEDVSIALVAPTGKAATRAKELLNNFISDEQNSVAHSVGVSKEVLHALSRIEPKTIQRVLGSKNRMHTRFEHDHSVHLAHDIIIIDEMSMVASYLMARLLEAIRPDATILLVGDQAQLESVESGSVLRDIVDASMEGQSAVSGCVFEL
jgi:exodeoxyribonuclease V alpha subunit